MDISIARLSDNRRRVRENLAGRSIAAPAVARLRRNENEGEPDDPVSSALSQTGSPHKPIGNTRYFIEMPHVRDDTAEFAPPG
jgi:hypothetical protein